MSDQPDHNNTNLSVHQRYMQRCLQLASQGLGQTFPNPMVGSVIVCNDQIIGEGWHQKAGEPHAEVHAINSVADAGLLNKSTLYVSLEPCSHFGKTPPCADLIVEHQIPRVVIGSTDPNPQVAGRGIEKLTNAGIEVVTGVLKKECDWLNRRFFTFYKSKRPYIILKWAQTADGFIAPTAKNERAPVWISSQASRQLTHKWRSEEGAILIGTNTALSDNPSLTTRDWPGNSPLRIVIDTKGRLTTDLKLFDGSVPTLVLGRKIHKKLILNLDYVAPEPDRDLLDTLMTKLYQRQIQSLIVEGGAESLSRFINLDLWDEARVFVGHTIFKNGTKAPKIEKPAAVITKSATDSLHTYYNTTEL